MTIEQARQVLKENGYYVDNLWHIDDVKLQSDVDVDDDTAYGILNSALTNDWIMEQINLSISQLIED
jgi:hypothetical protein